MFGAEAALGEKAFERVAGAPGEANAEGRCGFGPDAAAREVFPRGRAVRALEIFAEMHGRDLVHFVENGAESGLIVGRERLLRKRNAVLFGQFAKALPKREAFDRHHEFDDVAFGVAAKAFIELVFFGNRKRRRFLAVKRAQAGIAAADAPQPHAVFGNDADDIDLRFEVLREFHPAGDTYYLVGTIPVGLEPDAILAIVKTEEAANPERIAVLGLGYVGCVTAACLAKLGHRVIGVDRDEFKVAQVLEGRAPFYEPGLEEIVQDAAGRGLLTATASLGKCIDESDIALICVGTPSESNGNIGLGQLRRACEELSTYLQGRTKPLIVVIRSTVFPGTCEEVVAPALGDRSKFVLVSNPEFLREGVAVKDFVEPALVVVGGDDPTAVKRVAALYAALDVEPCLVTLRTAEMIKYACNCFHALKIGFANEIGSLCTRLNIPANEVMSTLCRDDRLNISPAYLKPGFAFGGSCLPKDLRALTYRASRLDLDLPLLQHVMASNEAHLQRAIDQILALGPVKLGVFGLAFKENTDDLRESPVVTLIEHLIGKGRELRIFDPHIQLDQIYGSNRQFVLNAIPHVGRLMVGDVDSMLDWAEYVVLTQKPAAALRERLVQSGKQIVNVAEMK